MSAGVIIFGGMLVAILFAWLCVEIWNCFPKEGSRVEGKDSETEEG